MIALGLLLILAAFMFGVLHGAIWPKEQIKPRTLALFTYVMLAGAVLVVLGLIALAWAYLP